MTAIAAGPATPRGRILNVVRLQFVNTQTFIWVPLLVLGGSWILSLLIFWLISGAAGPEAYKVAGAAQAPLWYFLVIGVYALTLSFPFSQAMSLTRREFYLGTLVAAALSALALSLIFLALGLFEQATDGYGMTGYYAYLPWMWEAGPAAATLTYFVATMLVFVLGFWAATIYKRFGTLIFTATLFAIGLALLGLIALATWQEAWPDVWRWFAETGALGLTLWAIPVVVLLAGGSYLTLRRMPA
ncbi:hypothetical protein QWJ90_13775 [Microbacterium oryzae]|uniref:hypothetical protein n=1 Tax=Microbacterium oryzae TaxID=743009 RepID=UPI0025B159E2|nr:hypothetical protein [Microbacterium oryzae]MDN3311999.1 hypothetical protein [Microbacterium oryzae]